MTGSAFRTVAPVLAVCAAFRTQPSAYPPEATKPNVAPTCGGVLRKQQTQKKQACRQLPAEKLLQQELVTARKTENGQWYAITTDPQPKMSESEQMQEMQL